MLLFANIISGMHAYLDVFNHFMVCAILGFSPIFFGRNLKLPKSSRFSFCFSLFTYSPNILFFSSNDAIFLVFNLYLQIWSILMGVNDVVNDVVNANQLIPLM